MTKKILEIETKQMSDSEKQRIEEAYEQLLCFNPTGVRLKPNQEWTPAWSSYLLEQLIEKVLSAPEGRISDLFLGFWKALEVTKAPLTKWMSNFIDQMFRYCLIHYIKKNKSKFFQWFKREEIEFMVPLVNKGCTQAQALFALNVIPPQFAADCKEAILRALQDTDFIEFAQSQLSQCFIMTVPLEKRLEEIFEDVKVRHDRGGLVDWNDLSYIYHAITYCNNSETLKATWLKKILSFDFTPKLIEEVGKEAKERFDRIQHTFSNEKYLNEYDWEIVLKWRLELEVIKDFFNYRMDDFPKLNQASLCEKMKKMSQTKENKKIFDFSVSQLKQDSPLPFVDIWFQSDFG